MLCLNCQTETKNPKFCSLRCAAIVNGRLYPKRIKTTKETVNSPKPKKQKRIRLCLFCNQPCKNEYRATFCGYECAYKYKTSERMKEIDERGYIFDNTVSYTSNFAKKYMISRFGNYCAICKIDATWNNQPLALVLDHINGQSNDWSISNLRLVCPNCDSQLPTFKSKNKGNGRPRKA